jgi:polyisoprenoid-binding protein YceI
VVGFAAARRYGEVTNRSDEAPLSIVIWLGESFVLPPVEFFPTRRTAMKKHSTRMFAYALAASLLAAPAVKAAPQNFELDQHHFSIVFSVSHMSMSYTYGLFRQAQGRFVIDKDNPAANQFQLAINADSIDTVNPKRDQHLKGPDFLDVAQFPNITFTSTSCTLDNRQPGKIVYLVTGDLTMHGVTKSVTLPIEMLGEGAAPGGGEYHAGFVSQFELKRSEFGMTNLLNMVGDAIGITVSFEGIKQ